MSDQPRATTPSLSGLTYEEKVDEILRIVRGLASTAVEHDARIKFIESAVDVNAEDTTLLGGRIRHIENSVDQLTKIAEAQGRRITDHEKSIHELRDDEARRPAVATER